MLAEASAADLHALFIIVALIGFAVAIWLAVRAQYIGAAVAALVAVLILLYG